MILTNNTSHHQMMEGKRVRPMRTIVVPDGIEYDEEVWGKEKSGRALTKKDKERIKDYSDDLADDGKRNRSNKKKGD